MKFKADEIASVIQQEIERFESRIDVSDVGQVVEVGDGIARVSGHPDAAVNEMLRFENGLVGLALNLDEDSIGAVVLGDDPLERCLRDIFTGLKRKCIISE